MENKMNYFIYRIVCNDINITECYVGKTTNFINRKYHHKCACINPNHHNHKYFLYNFIRENGGWENWSMIEIERYFLIDAIEASKYERHWFEFYKPILNKCVPARTQKESKLNYRINQKLK